MKWTDVVSAVSSGMSATLAIVAAIVAVFAVRAALRANETQNKQLKRLEASQEQELASKFAVWIRRSDPDGPPWFQVMYANTSGLPILNVKVQLSYNGKFVVDEYLTELEPTDRPTPLDRVGRVFSNPISVNCDGNWDESTSNNIQKIMLHDTEIGYAARASPRYKIDLLFEDSNGNMWIRRHGELIPVSDTGEASAYLYDGSTGKTR